MKFDTASFKQLFSRYSQIKLAYLFGSQAQGKYTALSDYDFGVYFAEEIDAAKRFDIKLQLIADLSDILKTDKVDVVVLNDDLDPLLKYHIVRYGKIIFEKKPFRLILEPRIYSEFFDYQVFAKHHRL